MNTHYFSKNKPALGDAFKHDEVKEFLQILLENLNDADTLKHFLTVGYKEYYKEKIKEISKHFYILNTDGETHSRVKRCIDGAIFKVGDMVMDMEYPAGRSLPIGRMYEDERGLHVRLDLEPDGKSITWRNLSNIEHDLPF